MYVDSQWISTSGQPIKVCFGNVNNFRACLGRHIIILESRCTIRDIFGCFCVISSFERSFAGAIKSMFPLQMY